jgi:hypothetical protein
LYFDANGTIVSNIGECFVVSFCPSARKTTSLSSRVSKCYALST